MTPIHPHDDAPLFAQYWLHSALNPTRAALLAQRIGQDAARPHAPPRPRHAAAATPLPPADSALAACHARRASQRAFGPQPLTAQALSNLLLPLAAKPGGATRHLPSGGGKYPIQVYGALYAVAHAPALHGQRVWYDPLAHGLTPLGPLPPWPELATALGVDWPAPPASVWLLAAEPHGMLRKYGERGGRFILLEAGACLGALGLQAAEAGLAGVALGSFHDEALCAAFGLPRGPTAPLAVLAYAVGPPAATIPG